MGNNGLGYSFDEELDQPKAKQNPHANMAGAASPGLGTPPEGPSTFDQTFGPSGHNDPHGMGGGGQGDLGAGGGGQGNLGGGGSPGGGGMPLGGGQPGGGAPTGDGGRGNLGGGGSGQGGGGMPLGGGAPGGGGAPLGGDPWSAFVPGHGGGGMPIGGGAPFGGGPLFQHQSPGGDLGGMPLGGGAPPPPPPAHGGGGGDQNGQPLGGGPSGGGPGGGMPLGGGQPGGGGGPQLGDLSSLTSQVHATTDPQQKAVLRDQLGRNLYGTFKDAGHDVKWEGDHLIVDGRPYVVAGGAQPVGQGGQPLGSGAGGQQPTFGDGAPTGDPRGGRFGDGKELGPPSFDPNQGGPPGLFGNGRELGPPTLDPNPGGPHPLFGDGKELGPPAMGDDTPPSLNAGGGGPVGVGPDGRPRLLPRSGGPMAAMGAPTAGGPLFDDSPGGSAFTPSAAAPSAPSPMSGPASTPPVAARRPSGGSADIADGSGLGDAAGGTSGGGVSGDLGGTPSATLGNESGGVTGGTGVVGSNPKNGDGSSALPGSTAGPAAGSGSQPWDSAKGFLVGFDTDKLNSATSGGSKYTPAAKAFGKIAQSVGLSRGNLGGAVDAAKQMGFPNAKSVGDDKIDFGDGMGPIDVIRSDGQVVFQNTTGNPVWEKQYAAAGGTGGASDMHGTFDQTFGADPHHGAAGVDVNAHAPGGPPAPPAVPASDAWKMTGPTYTPGSFDNSDLNGLSMDDILGRMGDVPNPKDINSGDLGQLGAGATDPQTQDLMSKLLQHPESMDPQTVDMLKAKSKDELADMANTDDEDMKAMGYQTGNADSNWLASQRLARKGQRDSALVNSNRSIDMTAAQTNQADRRAAAQLGQSYGDSVNNRNATNFGEKFRVAQQNIDNQFKSSEDKQQAVKLAADTQLAAAAQRGDRKSLEEQFKQKAAELGQSADKLRQDWVLGLMDDATKRYGIDVGSSIDRAKLSQAGSEFQMDLAFRIMQLRQQDEQFGASYGLDAAGLQERANEFGQSQANAE